MSINYRQRYRRQLRSLAARIERTGTRLDQPVPCSLGDHKVSIALHPDGSLLSIHSECYDTPPSPEERAVVRSLVGAEKFMTCADSVRFVLSKIGGGEHIEPSEGFPYNPRDMFAETRAHALNTLITNLRTVSTSSDSPWKGNFSGEHRKTTLRKLSIEDSTGEELEGDENKWLGRLAGVETRLATAVQRRGDERHTKIVAQARHARSHTFETVATYLGKGRFKINRDALKQAARSVTSNYSYRGASCLVCARSYTSLKNHVRSDRHQQRFEEVVFDNLITLGSRLYRNQ